ncbi:MAG TPA: choice-of-anchor Q domain-containing protein, partial [Rhodanobacteraceae bacterium]|nr:choice-of-anchor Q domain-containing protein [Rhodanobacteraceae bacterium]
ALDCGTITLTQGVIDVSVLGPHHVNDLSIVGPGADALTIDGNGDRVFAHGDFQIGLGTLAIRDLAIANGNYTHGLASCIDSSGNVELTRAVVTGCHASGGAPLTFGGAVSAAYLTMTSSRIADSLSAAAGDNVAIGGGAYVSGDATLVDSTISGNIAISPTGGDGTYYIRAGGGLYVRGALAMTTSTITHNTLVSYFDPLGPGGGVFVRADADISYSTFDANLAGTGGALEKAVFSPFGDPGTTLSIANSTFSGNGAYFDGGAIRTVRPTSITSSTIARNNSGFTIGGIACSGSDVTIDLQSTILAWNHVGDTDGVYLDLFCYDPVTITGSRNLVLVSGGVTLPDDTLDVDPLLGALADNGGPTETMALDPSSPAIDAGSNDGGFDFDQRGAGFPRVLGSRADIGAFEAQSGSPDDTIFANGFD